MWRGLFIALIFSLLSAAFTLTKERGWRFGIGTILFVLTAIALLIGVIVIDVR